MTYFLSVELPYLVIALLILAGALFVATRPFVPPTFLSRGVPSLSIILFIAIGTHFVISEQRREALLQQFLQDQTILCSDRRSKMGDRSIEVDQRRGWHTDGSFFINSDGEKFFIRQCISQ